MHMNLQILLLANHIFVFDVSLFFIPMNDFSTADFVILHVLAYNIFE